VKLRLNSLERAVSQGEDAIEADQRMAETLKRIWRYEYASQLSDAEVKARMELAREIHSGNPDVAADFEAVIAAENEYIEGRLRLHVAGLRPGERSRWQKLLSGR